MWITVIDADKNIVLEEEHLDHEESGIEISAKMACEVRAQGLFYCVESGQSILISENKIENPGE